MYLIKMFLGHNSTIYGDTNLKVILRNKLSAFLEGNFTVAVEGEVKVKNNTLLSVDCYHQWHTKAHRYHFLTTILDAM